jgi:hypothetical protein
MANSDTLALIVGILAICLALIGFMLPESTPMISFPYASLTGIPNTFPYANLTGIPNTFPYANLTGNPSIPIAVFDNYITLVDELSFKNVTTWQYLNIGFNVISGKTYYFKFFCLWNCSNGALQLCFGGHLNTFSYNSYSSVARKYSSSTAENIACYTDIDSFTISTGSTYNCWGSLEGMFHMTGNGLFNITVRTTLSSAIH